MQTIIRETTHIGSCNKIDLWIFECHSYKIECGKLTIFVQIQNLKIGFQTSCSKGFVIGNLQIYSDDNKIINFLHTPISIFEHLIEFANVYTLARFVLIVEKDSIFQRLMDEKFVEKFPDAILVTVRKLFFYSNLISRVADIPIFVRCVFWIGFPFEFHIWNFTRWWTRIHMDLKSTRIISTVPLEVLPNPATFESKIWNGLDFCRRKSTVCPSTKATFWSWIRRIGKKSTRFNANFDSTEMKSGSFKRLIFLQKFFFTKFFFAAWNHQKYKV